MSALLVTGRTDLPERDVSADGAGVEDLPSHLAGPVMAAEVRVTVPLDQLLGAREGGTELGGYGPIAPATAAALALGGTWRRLVTDPLSGAVLDVGTQRYQPPSSLDRHVRLRDGTCRRPGCTIGADACDLDHTVPFGEPGGRTAADNLGALCRRDHLLKAHAGFRLVQVAPGTFEWVTPTGHRYLQPVGDRLPEPADDELLLDLAPQEDAGIGPPPHHGHPSF
jgi:hypothetical protein